jgi:hypothetical protein
MLDATNPYARRFASLSITDLLDAREAVHVHFMQMENVFATAIGLYRIRRDDLDYSRYHPAGEAAQKDRGKKATPRTMENTVVQPWSWPSVLVFVKDWLKPADYHAAMLRGQIVPPFIDLPDGRVIPTCVIQASLWEGAGAPLIGYQFSRHLIGGGYPVVTMVQGQEHIGSIGCLVTDGVRHFALTNQHVAGEAGSEIFALLQGDGRRIGTSAKRSVRSEPFQRLYPGFPGGSTRGNLDAGLIDVDDLGDWTAQVFGLGVLGPIVELNAHTASLDWIGTQAVAHGAHSGSLKGEIKALFYRYRTIGGLDYVSDFLLGGVDGEPLKTMPGDSGTLWCFESNADAADSKKTPQKNPRVHASEPAHASGVVYRPFALEWGGQKVTDGSSAARFTQYALATSLAIVCRELDVEIVTDLNAELTQYWGAVGHYKIAERAVDSTTGKLNAFLNQNMAQLTYSADVINGGSIKPSANAFVPLADVPDVVWKSNINRGGAAVRPQENWNHYADMDLPGHGGATLFDLSGINPKQKTLKATALSLADWKAFYASAPQPSASASKTGSINMGALPFRVWQIFDAMVAATKPAQFLCAAGILGHYVGDACQPLHSSMHSDGLNGASTGVHSTYEEVMIDRHAKELAAKLDAVKVSTLGAQARDQSTIKSGFEAGLAVIELMARAHRYLPPADICNTYESLGGGHGASVIAGLWQAYADPTAKCIADGARTLGQLWQAAYDLNPQGDFAGAIPQTVLRPMYEDKTFLPSLHLAHLDEKDFQP